MVWLSTHWPWWACAAAAAVTILVFTLRWRGVSLLQWTSSRWSFRRGLHRRALIDVPAAFDHIFSHSESDDTAFGFRWDGGTLITVLEIEDTADDLTVLEPGATVSGEMVALDLLADCLQQFDVELDSIDVISHGSRSHGHNPLAAVYDAVLGPLPAIAHRTVWVTVRFDPSRCPAAVAARGGGRSGLLRTAMIATRRVANRLAGAGLRVRVLSASDIGQAVGQLCGGANLANLREDWQHCADGNYRMTSYALSGAILTTAGLSRLWAVPSDATTVALSLRNLPDGVIAVGGTVRFDTFGAPVSAPVEVLGNLDGRQFAALLSGLPLIQPVAEIAPWSFGGHSADFAGIEIPASGCGQVIGADDHGRAVALPVFGPRITRVRISGSLHLGQQVVLRAVALGARVLVHTNRSGAWRTMVEAVGDSRLLWVADFNRGALQAGSDRNYTVALFDGVPTAATRVGVTSMVLQAPDDPTMKAAIEEPDVVLQQVLETPERVAVITRANATIVSMVATDEELRYIGHSLRTG